MATIDAYLKGAALIHATRSCSELQRDAVQKCRPRGRLFSLLPRGRLFSLLIVAFLTKIRQIHVIDNLKNKTLYIDIKYTNFTIKKK